jgi:hypothetical protein
MREHGCFPTTTLTQLRRPCRPRHPCAVPRTSLRCVCTRRRNCIEQSSPFLEYAPQLVGFPAPNERRRSGGRRPNHQSITGGWRPPLKTHPSDVRNERDNPSTSAQHHLAGRTPAPVDRHGPARDRWGSAAGPAHLFIRAAWPDRQPAGSRGPKPCSSFRGFSRIYRNGSC